MDYEFDIVFDMDRDHNGIVTKSRCAALADQVFPKPDAMVGETILSWLTSGTPAPEPKPKIEPAKPRTQKELIALARRPMVWTEMAWARP